MAAIINQLNSVARDLDALNLAMRDISLSGTDLQTLETVAANLKDIIVVIEAKAGLRKRPWMEQAWKDSEPYRLKAQSIIATVLSKGRLHNPAVFRRNIKLIYCGSQQSEFDSKDTKWRRGVVQKRCSRIQQLSPDGIVSWAIAYPPTTWGPCFMSNDTFDCLIEDIEPRDRKKWPDAVCQTLSRLKDGEVQGCYSLEQLVHNLENPSQQDEFTNPDMPIQAVQTAPRNPDNEHRVQNSALWKWERSQGHGTTACVATLFPKDETQDVSFTIWVGHNDGYRLNDTYGVKHALSS
ncbi:uncharacterized protein N7487_001649 [Penicillium crustosum]|uniref:uncharacterized protein n=1 Tax=Penicillium crustosum TaxID=36656 RepID=UPI002394581A|nr:uncharacterized protein N7487_001649 [Penicillium crustosum]KAJ5418099.1 hypothetical protein N7487_001649 [Penicillium crustosum]